MAEPVWIGPYFPNEGFATLRCGEAHFRIGFTTLHVLGIQTVPGATYLAATQQFMEALEALEIEAAKGRTG